MKDLPTPCKSGPCGVGASQRSPVEEASVQSVESLFELNVAGTLRLTHAVLPMLLSQAESKKRRCRIVVIGSMAGLVICLPQNRTGFVIPNCPGSINLCEDVTFYESLSSWHLPSLPCIRILDCSRMRLASLLHATQYLGYLY